MAAENPSLPAMSFEPHPEFLDYVDTTEGIHSARGLTWADVLLSAC